MGTEANEMSEASLYKPILHYLALKRIDAWRNNTGAVQAEHNGHKRFIRYGRKGQADITGIMRDGRMAEEVSGEIHLQEASAMNQIPEIVRVTLQELDDDGKSHTRNIDYVRADTLKGTDATGRTETERPIEGTNAREVKADKLRKVICHELYNALQACLEGHPTLNIITPMAKRMALAAIGDYEKFIESQREVIE